MEYICKSYRCNIKRGYKIKTNAARAIRPRILYNSVLQFLFEGYDSAGMLQLLRDREVRSAVRRERIRYRNDECCRVVGVHGAIRSIALEVVGQHPAARAADLDSVGLNGNADGSVFDSGEIADNQAGRCVNLLIGSEQELTPRRLPGERSG